MPPDGASVHRPFGIAEVELAWERGQILEEEQAQPGWELPAPTGSAIDVARNTDRTVLATVHDDIMRIHYNERGTDHTEQGPALKRILAEMAPHPIAVDFIGHGSSIHDQLNKTLPQVGKFESGSMPTQKETYKDKWSEGMDLLGEWLEDGGVIQERSLRKEMKVGARELEFSENYYKSRDAEVYELSSKDDIKDRLDHSPDLLDAAMMAAWAASDETAFDEQWREVSDDDRQTISSTW